MLTRILTAVALLPGVAAVYWGPAWLFALLATGAGLGCVHEAARLFEARGRRPLRGPAFAGVVLVSAAFYAPDHLPVEAALAAAAALVFGASLLVRPIDEALDAIGPTLAILVYPGLLLGFQIAIRMLPPEAGVSPPSLLVFLYAAVFGNDAAAYFAGRAFGRTKLAPAVSPKKTVEGFLGGIIGGTALALGVKALLPGLEAISWGRAGLFAALVAVAAVLGDLSKSAWKRSANVKDSGTLLPGHGGILDRLDGLMFASPLLWLLVTAPVPEVP